jgi:septum formation topological specificity factor MinE
LLLRREWGGIVAAAEDFGESSAVRGFHRVKGTAKEDRVRLDPVSTEDREHARIAEEALADLAEMIRAVVARRVEAALGIAG